MIVHFIEFNCLKILGLDCFVLKRDLYEENLICLLILTIQNG